MKDELFGKTVKEIYDKITRSDAEKLDLKRDNANINGDTPMGAMLQQGANTAKEYYLNEMIPPRIAMLHREGYIHIHDLDFYGWTTTCTQIELRRLFKEGFDTGHGHLREPKSIGSYAALAAIAIQSNQNDQHGGQSIADFDYAMADGVLATYKKYRDEAEQIVMDFCDEDRDEWCIDYATRKTKRDTYQAMEGLIHNLNTMHSRAGAQVPFSSINYGMCTSWAGRLAIEQLLLATEAGLGNGETPIFPIQIFRVKDGVNYKMGDPNYDLFKLAIRVSAKRLFPNFSFIDAPFNLQYYKEGHPETEVGYMGAVTGEDVITIKVDGKIYTLPFKEAYIRFSNREAVMIKDRDNFVPIKAWQCYPDGHDWYEIRMKYGRYLRLTADHPLPTQRGRVLCENLKIGDKIPRLKYQMYCPLKAKADFDPWVLGVLVTQTEFNGRLSEEIDSDVRAKLIGLYGENFKVSAEFLVQYFGAVNKDDRRLPTDFMTWCLEDRKALLAGLIDGAGFTTFCSNKYGNQIRFNNYNKTLSIEIMMLAESLGCNAYFRKTSRGTDSTDKKCSVTVTLTVKTPMVSEKKKNSVKIGEKKYLPDETEIVSIKKLGYMNETRFDVTTASDRFDVSGISSHNCRTRVMGNVYDPSREICYSRGNLSFTSINLPRLAIEAHGDVSQFFGSLNFMLRCTMIQLMARYQVQAKRKVRNFPFLMGQNVWLDSEKLDTDEEVGEVLKHGTLSIGFIGLAECLKMLTGKHHGESKEAQALGLRIVKRIRYFCDDESQRRQMNVTCLATPAEGLSGRFVRLDREKFGIIDGVTDRDYYTNSFHVPVYYPISIAEKIAIEAPYHALTNAGHISYIEMDGDTTKNLEAFEKTIRLMKEAGIGYGAINHPVDRDPVCGYNGIIGDTCPKCGRKETPDEPFERIRRITGYLVGSLNRWNNAKRAEEHDRVKHTLEGEK